MTNRITLRGCAPEPLIHYLKALGVLRLVAEQLDPEARGAWSGDAFVLDTGKTEDELLDFFLTRYCPTPVVAPWNGGSGFYPQDKNQRALIEVLERAEAARLDDYRTTIAAARRVVAGRKEQPKDEEKAALLRRARCEFPDSALAWLDAAFVLGEEKADYPPLLGSGGNDGRLDFTINFIARLLSVLPEAIELQTFAPLREDGRLDPAKQDKLRKKLEQQRDGQMAQSRNQLRAALFQDGVARLERAAVGQFYPAGAGGANATQGLAGDSYVNPWDFILAIEGTLVFASATVRQLAAGARSKASFPFTARNSTVGYGTASPGEKMRAEIWLPLWSRFTGYAEVSHVFREGRVQFSRRRDRAVRTGFDFARAVAELGIDRGIDAFQRYGFIERNGQANLAAPLGRFDIPKGERTRAALIHELDHWLDRLSRATSDTKRTPPRLIRVREQIEEAIFDLCASGEAEHLRATLLALGEAEAELARALRFREEYRLQPLSGLSADWERECDDVTPEFEVAAALASIGGERGRWAFRTSLEPVEVSGPAVNWTSDDAGAVWGAGTPAENVAAVLHRRSVDARRAGLSHPVMDGRRVASLHAVGRFLNSTSPRGGFDDERTEALLRGLALIDWHNAAPRTAGAGAAPPPELPRAYALLKLLFLPRGELVREPGGKPVLIKHEPSIVPLLRAGHVPEALKVATRRLRSSGLTPFTSEFLYPNDEGVRLAAALLIPISEGDVRELANMVLRPPASAE
ncbi:MAG: type I-U CRISPR-associated protein Csx17 [Acidobacteria bacterium]|nr:type I-U CRISPR-associated protein Csx17 [Acidobacteriota bacterium]